MEHSEYRKRQTERSIRIYGSVAGLVSAADLTSGLDVLDHLQGAVIDLPWHGGVTGIVVSGLAVSATLWTRHRRSTLEYQHRQALRAREWAGRRDRRRTIGVPAARSLAAISRPGMTWRERLRAHPAEVGIPVGRTVSGPWSARGHQIVIPWEEGGALVLGEPGSRKSTFLAGVVVGAPGAQVVVSTKDEFLRRTWQARAGRGPVYAFSPLSSDAMPEGVYPLAWSLVAGCRDPRIAARRAHALMSATADAGLANAGFWESKGRAVLTALLCAADLQGAGLRTLARWLQEERYVEAAEVLERYPDQVEASMVATLRQMVGNADRTASSVSHTASAVLEFLQDGRIAAALDADRDNAVDLADFVRRNGTLYMVTDSSPALGPVVSAIWDSIVDAAKEVAIEQRMEGREARLRTPLLLVADEVDKTMPAVPLDSYVAELRGWGVFTLAATQNRARLTKVWGRDGMSALCGSLQVHVIMSLNAGEDREYYERRLGRRSVQVMRVSESAPATVWHRIMGNPVRHGHSQSHSVEEQRVPLWDAEMWSHLERGYAVVVPTRGRPAVVNIGNGWQAAEAAAQHVRATAAHREWQEEARRYAEQRTREAEAQAALWRAARESGAESGAQ